MKLISIAVEAAMLEDIMTSHENALFWYKQAAH